MQMDERTQKLNASAQTGKISTLELDAALKGLGKLLGAMRFYPMGHPALKDVTRDARQGFLPLLSGRESIVLQVRRDGFSFEEKPFGNDNPMLHKLAGAFFARRVQQLMVLNDLSCRDLWRLSQILMLDVAATQKQGGIQETLQRNRVSTLWVNVVDVASIFELKTQYDREKAEIYGVGEENEEKFLSSLGSRDGSDPGEALAAEPTDIIKIDEMTLERLLRELGDSTTDQAFIALLPQLPPLVRANLDDSFAPLVLRALWLVAENVIADGQTSSVRRDAARQTLAQLATADILSYFVDLLCGRSLLEAQRNICMKISEVLGAPLTYLLMARLGEEGDQAIRKTLSEALVRQGSVALPAVIPCLEDDRWFVVRNATHIIGEIRDPTTVEKLKLVLQHSDLRVRREAIRALTRIGGNSVVGILLRTLQGDDTDLRRQAMLSLGAMKNPAAVPALTQFIQAPDWRVRQLEGKRDAIRALGEIGALDALPVLTRLVCKGKIFYRARHNELRAAAAGAIGEIGGPEAVTILENLTVTSSQVVARAASQALRQARKVNKK